MRVPQSAWLVVIILKSIVLENVLACLHSMLLNQDAFNVLPDLSLTRIKRPASIQLWLQLLSITQPEPLQPLLNAKRTKYLLIMSVFVTPGVSSLVMSVFHAHNQLTKILLINYVHLALISIQIVQHVRMQQSVYLVIATYSLTKVANVLVCHHSINLNQDAFNALRILSSTKNKKLA